MDSIVAFPTEGNAFTGIIGVHGDCVLEDIIPIAIKFEEASECCSDINDVMNNEIVGGFTEETVVLSVPFHPVSVDEGRSDFSLDFFDVIGICHYLLYAWDLKSK